MQTDSILRLPQVMAATGLRRTSIYRLQGEGQFPKAIRLGARAVGWKASELQSWIDQRHRAGTAV